ncbi:membrane protein required for colicin V production [Alphaproteobacteria bacterium]
MISFEILKINAFDILLIIIVLLSTLTAFNRGFIGAVLSLGGWVLSIILTYLIFPYLEPFLQKHTNGSEFLTFCIGYVGGLIFFLLFFAILNFIISMSLGSLVQGKFNKFLGACFGIFKGWLLISFLFLCFSVIASIFEGKNLQDDEVMPSFIQKAQSFNILKMSRAHLLEFLPQSISQSIHSINANNKKTNILLIAAIKKLARYATPETAHKIGEEAQNIDSYKSEQQMAIDTLMKLLQNYKQSYREGLITEDQALSSSELRQIENLVKEK